MSEFYPLDESLPVLTADNQACSDHEFTLNGDSVWITVGNISVYINKGDEGVSVDLFPCGSETDDPIASIWASYSEAVPNE